MTDIYDMATEREEFDRKVAHQNKKPELPHIGKCHWCGELLQHGVFCDADCRTDYERAERFKR